MKNIKGFASLLFIFLLTACDHKLSRGEYVKEIETSKDLNQIKVFDNIEFKMMYRPSIYYAYKSGRTVNVTDSSHSLSFVLAVRDLSSHQEVLRRFVNEQEAYGQMVNYFAFQGEKDFKLISGSDTAKCSFYHFERFNNISPTINFDLGFESSNITGDITIVYNDKVFGVGSIYFRFKKEALDQIHHTRVE